MPLDQITVPENVRELDAEHVQALAGSIRLQGMLVPAVVRPAGDRFELVAGFHRVAAARALEIHAGERPGPYHDTAAARYARRALEHHRRRGRASRRRLAGA